MENITHQWKSEYELGIEAIDHQHRYLFDLSLRLSREIERSDNLLYRKSLVEELSAYAHFHMRSEENMMQREEYPELGAHKLLHRQLIDILSSKTSKFYLTPSSRHWHEMMVFFSGCVFPPCHQGRLDVRPISREKEWTEGKQVTGFPRFNTCCTRSFHREVFASSLESDHLGWHNPG